MVKYFKRTKQNGTVFYVDGSGHEISEAEALRWSKSEIKVGGTRQRVIELSENAPPRILQNEERARQNKARAKLTKAFKRQGIFRGMSAAEAAIAAKGR